MERAVLTAIQEDSSRRFYSRRMIAESEKTRPEAISVLASSRAGRCLQHQKVDGISRIYFNYEGNDNLAVRSSC
ncbi:MAG: hypothetical protein ACLR1V_03985 [Coprococcus sp.]